MTEPGCHASGYYQKQAAPAPPVAEPGLVLAAPLQGTATA